jgi:3-oxoacyl-[acyl-carrier protein] reductase
MIMKRKIALVTGGSRGIGRAICVRLAGMGYYVLINYKSNEAEAALTLEIIRGTGGDGELLRFDVSDAHDSETVISKWIASNDGNVISVLVNNAGIRRDSLLMWMSLDDWNDVLNNNLNSFYFVTRLLIKDMILKKWGRIINVVSLSGQKGLSGQTNYSAAKAGVIGATKALALEVAKKNVTVNAVAPGFISTDMTKELDENQLKQMIPMGRFGKPEEVAAAVGFFASEEASYITGCVVNVNGGIYT